MPQGGPGNCGGNLNGSGGSKRKMGLAKRRAGGAVKSKAAAVPLAAEEGAGGGPAFTVHAPAPEQRAELVRGAREELLRCAQRRAAPVDGTAPGGEALGGAASGCDRDKAREARLLLLERTPRPARSGGAGASGQCAGAARSPPAPGCAADGDTDTRAAAAAAAAVLQLHATQRTRRVREEGGEADVVETLHSLLAERLRGRHAESIATIKRILSNAATKGTVDAKYLTLRAANEKVWHLVLRHPELVAILKLAGFEHRSGAEVAQQQLELLQVRLQEQLDSGLHPNGAQGHVDSLVTQIEQLTFGASRHAPTDVDRESEFVHRATCSALDDLATVLTALHAVSPSSTQACQAHPGL